MSRKAKADGDVEVSSLDGMSEIGENGESAEAKVKAAVDSWVNRHLRNSDFSRNTAAWNHLNNVLPNLVEGILKEVR